MAITELERSLLDGLILLRQGLQCLDQMIERQQQAQMMLQRGLVVGFALGLIAGLLIGVPAWR
jgi:hypothetical protein